MSKNGLQNVMMNQLPELAGPKKKSTKVNNKMMPASFLPPRRNPYAAKWFVLFDNRNEQWISFQPQVGSIAYPCYACKHLFGNKSSLLDHVNRRGLLLKYKCTPCKKLLMFYNTCSFLLHARTHFTDQGGAIDLDHVDISMIPLHLAGFLPITNLPRLYDTADDSINHNLQISVKFHKPVEDCAGKRIVVFTPNDLVFFCTNNYTSNINKEVVTLVLKQVNKNIPKCIFVAMNINHKIPHVRILPKVADDNKCASRYPTDSSTLHADNDNKSIIYKESNTSSDMDIETENESNWSVDNESDIIDVPDCNPFANIETVIPKKKKHLPKIQVKNLNLLVAERTSTPSSNEEELEQGNLIVEAVDMPNCPECDVAQSMPMKDHFQEINRPINDKIKCAICGLISPSACSLKAHIRTHEKSYPFVCPECGKDFDKWDKLYLHMEEVCFHRAKNVRYKCPAKKCGKVFAQTFTFSSHFPLAHMKYRFACDNCSGYFLNEIEFANHAQIHLLRSTTYHKIHECTVCAVLVTDLRAHVLGHIQNKDNRIYVYICKYCRSYYRSKHTYAAHLLRCAKLLLNNQVKKEAEQLEYKNGLKCKIVKYCKLCKTKMQFNCTYRDIQNIRNNCPRCYVPFFAGIMYKIRTMNNYEYTDNIYVRKDNDTGNVICILCSSVLKPDECADYNKHKCKYNKPIVQIQVKSSTAKSTTITRSSSSSFSTISSEGLVSPDDSGHLTLNNVSPDETTKRKRKRISSGWVKNKRQAIQIDNTDDILPISPIVFNGEYKCSVCAYKNKAREIFHKHIQEHRDISTAYQCMECGECFVVKPSLMKHLQVLHLIEDVDDYFANNECYDKDAVRELEENMRLLPGEVKEPVAENQCRICRQMFPDSQELSKHFRVHGMAFLMKKIIK